MRCYTYSICFLLFSFCSANPAVCIFDGSPGGGSGPSLPLVYLRYTTTENNGPLPQSWLQSDIALHISPPEQWSFSTDYLTTPHQYSLQTTSPTIVTTGTTAYTRQEFIEQPHPNVFKTSTATGDFYTSITNSLSGVTAVRNNKDKVRVKIDGTIHHRLLIGYLHQVDYSLLTSTYYAPFDGLSRIDLVTSPTGIRGHYQVTISQAGGISYDYIFYVGDQDIFFGMDPFDLTTLYHLDSKTINAVGANAYSDEVSSDFKVKARSAGTVNYPGGLYSALISTSGSAPISVLYFRWDIDGGPIW